VQQLEEAAMIVDDDKFKFPDEVQVTTDSTTDDVEVEVVDDTPEADRGARKLEETVEDPSDEELASYSKNVQARIQKLTHARHDERREKERLSREKDELERAAARLIEDNRRLRAFADEGSKQVAASTVAAAEAALAQARQKAREAQESFDTEAIIAAQEELASAKWKLEAAKNFRPTPLQADDDRVQPQNAETQQVRPDQKSLRWQAQNQWFGSDGFEEVTSFALGLHQKLVNGGVDPRSDEYYDQLNGRLRSKFPEVFGDDDKSKVGSPSKRPPSVVAPAARSAGPRKIKLTQTAVDTARRLGLTPQQYAIEVAKLEAKNG